MSLNGVNSNYQAYETNTVSGSDKKVSTKEISKLLTRKLLTLLLLPS